MMISKGNYGQYSTANYGANTIWVQVNNLTLYYSYNTIVAYEYIGEGLVCSENVWGVTTGKHLNWIQPNKKARFEYSEFSEKLTKLLNSLDLQMQGV